MAFIEKWEMVRGNTNLPIFVSAKITRSSIEPIMAINPDGIIIGSAIVDAKNPAEEAQFFYELCKRQ
jgi:3-keto-L-gulonate-6-phosphate decarboxylase